jgi:spore coat protein A, manganese oxidase
VFRPSTNNWYVLRSATSTYRQFVFGSAGDIPVVEDYDGDGRTDPALFRPSNGLWTVLQSSGNYISIYIQMLWGVSTDDPVPADYDGDGKADVAVYRDGTWYIFRSSVATGQQQVVKFGTTGDNPQPADYDGDLRVDQAIFRPSTGVWWLQQSTAGTAVVQFGTTGDIPAVRPFWLLTRVAPTP